jgi:hypothetical protein
MAPKKKETTAGRPRASKASAAATSPTTSSTSSASATNGPPHPSEPSSIVNAYTNVEDDEAALRAALGCGNPIVTESENLIVQLNVDASAPPPAGAACNAHVGVSDAGPSCGLDAPGLGAPGVLDVAMAGSLAGLGSNPPPSHHMPPYTPNNTFQSFPAIIGGGGSAGARTLPDDDCGTGPHPPSVGDAVGNVAGAASAPQLPSAAEGGSRVVELLKDFEMKSRSSEWPSSTSICCYWCCHTFMTPPFGIPVKYVEGSPSTEHHGKFHVFGCFCSLECAAAYNFDACSDSIDEKWERYSLINFLSRSLASDDPAQQQQRQQARVKLAPNRLALKMFGGHMSIEDFRATAQSSKMVNINFPPMATLTQQVEELNETDVRSEYRYIPLDIDRINRYKEKIILKRSKPTTASKKNTLDSLMNLRFTSN